VGGPDGSRLFGNPRRRWEDNIKLDLYIRFGKLSISDNKTLSCMQVSVNLFMLFCCMQVAVNLFMLFCCMQVAVNLFMLFCCVQVAVNLFVLFCCMQVAVNLFMLFCHFLHC
jgi:hypothetical protein